MTVPYTNIDKTTANKIKLIMSDVDGTMLKDGPMVEPNVADAVDKLQKSGIMFGLVSGRTLRELEEMARKLHLRGPVIAENGAIARLRPQEPLLDLGFTRQPAIEALKKLTKMFPGAIRGREDNAERMMDIVIRLTGITPDDIRPHIGDTQLLDSGYILHLMQPGINKGKTLVRILGMMENLKCTPDEVMVLGDSATDISLFELFGINVLVMNPNLPAGQPELLQTKAAYCSESIYGDGFTEVALHIVKLRENANK